MRVLVQFVFVFRQQWPVCAACDAACRSRGSSRLLPSHKDAASWAASAPRSACPGRAAWPGLLSHLQRGLARTSTGWGWARLKKPYSSLQEHIVSQKLKTCYL